MGKVKGFRSVLILLLGLLVSFLDPCSGQYVPPGGGGGGAPSGAAGGDLAATYPNPTVAKVNGVSVTGTPSSGQVPTATGAAAATWQTPGGGVPGGSTTQVQYNNAGAFGGSDILARDGTNRLNVMDRAGVNFTGIADPATAITAALILAAGNVDAGDHQYCYTYVTAQGETKCSALSNTVVADGTHGQVGLTGITVGATGTTARNVYRTSAAFPTDPPGLLTTIANNTTTVFTDNIADSSLGAIPPQYNSTAGFIQVSGTPAAAFTPSGFFITPSLLVSSDDAPNVIWQIDPNFNELGRPQPLLYVGGVGGNVGLGLGSFRNITVGVGTENTGVGNGVLTLLTTGTGNTCVGSAACSVTVTATRNTGVGFNALSQATAGNNTAVGYRAGETVTTGNSNTLLGDHADAAATVNNTLCLGYLATCTASDAVAIGHGVTNAVANSVNIGTNSAIYLKIPSAPGSTGKAACWKDANTMGFCSDAVGVTGGCTCN